MADHNADNSTSVNTVSTGFASYRNTSHLFSFPSVPQEGLNGRTFSVMGGVMLGGSSGVNALQCQRGQKEDYDRWGDYFSKCSDWSWEGILPYFKKVKFPRAFAFFVSDVVQAWNFHPPSPELVEQFDINYDESFWGTSSGIHASFPTFHWPFMSTPGKPPWSVTQISADNCYREPSGCLPRNGRGRVPGGLGSGRARCFLVSHVD